MVVGCGGEVMAAGSKRRVDLIVGCQKSLRLPRRLEPPHEFLSLSGRPMRSFNPVVQSLVHSVIGIRCEIADWLDVTPQFVGNSNPRLTKPVDQVL